MTMGLFTSHLLCVLIVISIDYIKLGAAEEGVVNVHLTKTETGYQAELQTQKKSHNLNLIRPSDSVLGENIHVLNVDVNENGTPLYRKWIPSEHEVASANDLYIDEANNAVVRISKHDESAKMTGVLSESNLIHDGASHRMLPLQKPRTDYGNYIQLGRNITYNRGTLSAVNAVVEMAIVCDKEFGDIFGQNNKKILDYFTVYMWDVNMRYKTLPSDNISFRVNGIVLISTKAAQPFIEEARAADGRAEFGRILDRYSKWLYSQRNSMPKHDLAPLVTSTNLEWGGGLAYMNAACWVDNGNGRDLGSAVWNDGGDWISTTVAAHELGHNLGAPHDDDKDFPGGCDQTGFIMSGGNENLRYFFSSCSNRLISNFVRSESASCLRRIDEPKNAAIDPSFSNPKAPTMLEMCKRLLKNDKAFMEDADTYDCKTMRCRRPGEGGVTWIHFFAALENIVCGDGGRCFRGVCRKPSPAIKNVGSGLCMIASNPFEFTAPATMINCPKDATPLERFLMTSAQNGYTLGTPYSINGNQESGDKCLYTGNAEGNTIWTDKCNAQNPWQIWELRDTGKGRFLLVHKITGRCAKPQTRNVGSDIQTLGACDAKNSDMLWTKYI